MTDDEITAPAPPCMTHRYAPMTDGGTTAAIDTKKEAAVLDIIADCEPVREKLFEVFTAYFGSKRYSTRARITEIAEIFGFPFRKEEDDYEQGE